MVWLGHRTAAGIMSFTPLALQSILAVSASLFCADKDIDRITAEIAGIGWETALAQAEAFLTNLTLEEKAGLVTGTTYPL